MESIAKLTGVSKEFHSGRGISGVNLTLSKGDIYGLLGPNGAGKTTLLKMLTGLLTPSFGSISLFGQDLDQSFASSMRKVGCMIESADFYDYVTARQYLKLNASFYPELPPQRLDEVLEAVGLAAFAKEKIRHFSTGMKQKLAMASSILHYPEFVIWDEPTNGLDIEGVVHFRALVKQLSAEQGITFLISSHMIHELEQLCNRVGILHQGVLVREGNVHELLADNISLEQYYIAELQKGKELMDNGGLNSSN
ncbi:ABC transporter [Paenibacillus helianthi]|uniref:ABC transporter n=1 Tax=Paenibacillus helianthi TaxID=1349432 RepID=A0ABX3EPU8_9BACL|nr:MULTISPECIES: ABC transporter ATP-binding protein [Paenibacillus]OKP87748.1 ABC transporter [Paenibacillus helianthi]OKP92535.1 ABC transporter [Paenibacillus sp. P3E]OKP93412.1 ABC transporter [Paenibacillus sp. P32E]